MLKATLGERARYAFDNTMSRGTIALVLWLGVLSTLALVFFAVVIKLFGMAPAGQTPEEISFFEAVWMSLMRTLDAGTMGGDQGTWWFRFAMLGVTMVGIFILSTLIGVLTSGIESKLDDLRKGRSRVIENGHTVILGWSPQIFPILNELAIANANRRDAVCVVMGEADKVEMEEEIAERVTAGRMRIVCRSGSPIDLTDLDRVAVQSSKSIIVLSPEDQDPDSHVIKTVLALTNSPTRRKEPYHIVAEIRDPANMEVAKLVGKDEAELLLVGDLVSRITVQTCRQAGLSVVYTELLDFDGAEIYFQEEPKLVGASYYQALLAYDESAVMGIRRANGEVLLNPPMDTRIAPGDRVIAVSEDDDTVKVSGKTDLGIDQGAFATYQPKEAAAEHTLILGWNWRVPTIVTELDQYVAPGSAIVIATPPDAVPEAFSKNTQWLKKSRVNYETGDTTDRRFLETLGIERFNHILVVCDDNTDPQRADARVLITLLHLRDMQDRSGKRFAIVSEMLDIRNRELAQVARADDFIVSDKLVSLMLSQIAENKDLNAVFTTLLSPNGSEIYLRPASDYVKLGQPVTFYTVAAAAAARNETVLGYKILADEHDSSKAFGVRVNPRKSDSRTFTHGDRIIVLADE